MPILSGEIPKEFFTVQSMLTLTGATGATFLVSNGIQHAFNVSPKWLGLVVAQTISFYGTFKTNGQGSDFIIAIVNGFLIYCSAAGATQVTAGKKTDPAVLERGFVHPPQSQHKSRRTFLTNWFQ